jgi:acetyl-CoA carboxylase biotin carboxyl carrier protein
MNLRRVMDLISLMEKKGIAEAEISGLLTRIRLKRAVPGAETGTPTPPPVPIPVTAAEEPEVEKAPEPDKVAEEAKAEKKKEQDRDEGLVPIQAPMVGTFYRAPSPSSPAYVEEGQFISQGDVVCIVEAMKLMNEIESEVAGRIRKILVENAQPVEFGQVLMLVEEPQ